MRNKNIVAFTPELQEIAQKFHCGNSILDHFLTSPLALLPSFGKTWVYLTEDQSKIIGYYNLTTGSIDQIENGQREKIGGTIHINYLAVDEQFQDHTADENTLFCDVLFGDVLELCEEIRSRSVGFSFLTLEATSDGHRLYSRFDFTELESDMIFSSDADESSLGCKMFYALDVE